MHKENIKIINCCKSLLSDDVDPTVAVMKLEKAPQETYADVGGMWIVDLMSNRSHMHLFLLCILGLDTQIQEIKESVELPLTHPEYYEEMGIRPPKGVILYGPPVIDYN